MNLETMLIGPGPTAPGAFIDGLATLGGETVESLVAKGWCPLAAAKTITLYTTYYGPTTFTGLQYKALTAARTQGHSIFALDLIETKTNRVADKLAKWKLRVKLCKTPAAQIEAVAREQLKKLLKPREVKEGVSLTHHANGLATLKATGKSVDIMDVHAVVDPQDQVESFLAAFRGGGAGKQRYIPIIPIYLDQICEFVDRMHNPGRYPTDADIRVRASNGAILTGKDLLERLCLDYGFIAALSREHGPLDLYRYSRTANSKQRLLLLAEGAECSWIGCHLPFDKCQIHHIHPWNHGGQTNMSNLTPLCPHHNGANEDHPPDGIPITRGRMVRMGTGVGWQAPGGTPPIQTRPTAAPPSATPTNSPPQAHHQTTPPPEAHHQATPPPQADHQATPPPES
ncbi:HNH endonuclease signature motif containing protein [Corynebacterium lizhenjunii]|uniref:HNH endonuclease signature motif containing protein n=1 Tax=Corynebacterium lizhenjunii TaxID=2709394 RepID=UPI0013ECA6AD|nr:HNH endonuclease signature motif containing protein [Corynebacterium lizhenjunii]